MDRPSRRKLCPPAVLKYAVIASLTLGNVATAGTGKVLYTFQGGTTGQNPSSLIIDASGNLFGTGLSTDAQGCFPVYCGIVFELSPGPEGHWNYQVLHVFPAGSSELAGLVMDKSGNIYGTTSFGGLHNQGFVFELTLEAGIWTESALYNFSEYPGDGSQPNCTLLFDLLGNLYGTTSSGGAYGEGTVFRLMPSEMGDWTEEILYDFHGKPDGASPAGTLGFDTAGNLFGTTTGGGTGTAQQCFLNFFNGCGTVFELAADAGGGWTESVLYSFDGHPAWLPRGILIAAGNLVGTTSGNKGALFELSPAQDGGWTAKIGPFGGWNGFGGGALVAGPFRSLFGVAGAGGTHDSGVTYRLTRKPNGSVKDTVLYNFTGGGDGSVPVGLVFDGVHTVYGVTQFGGNGIGLSGDGLIFEGRF